MKQLFKKTIHQIAKRHIEEFNSNPSYQGENFSWNTYAEKLGLMFIKDAIVTGTFGIFLTDEQKQEIIAYAIEHTQELLKEYKLV